MHELGIVFHMIDMIEDIGKENSLTSVSRVVLDLGEVSGVIPSYLTDCWDWAVKRSELLNGATLDVEQIDAVTICNACGRQYGTVEHGRTCPHCGSPDTQLLRGNEVELREIEAC